MDAEGWLANAEERVANNDACIAAINEAFTTAIANVTKCCRDVVENLRQDETRDLLLLHFYMAGKQMGTFKFSTELDRLGFLILEQQLRDWTSIAATPSILFESGGLSPGGIAVTKSGERLVVANCVSDQVVILTLSGKVVRVIGNSRGNGHDQFNRPHGIAVDSTGNIWVADINNNRVRVFTEQGRFVRSVPVAAGPLAVDFLSNGNAVVLTSFDKVIIFTPDGQRVRSFGGTGTGNGKFNNLYDVKVSLTDEIFVADSANHRVQVLAADGTWRRSFGGTREEMTRPTGIALTPDSFVIVVEYSGHRISVWSPTGERVHRLGSKGSTPGQFKYPMHIAILPDGRVAVADSWNNRIQIF
jgi:DNA-binding beta-propeller fold protein YncE